MADSSPTGKLSAADWLKGLVMAAGSAALTLIQQVIASEANWIDKINWKTVGGVALAAAITYILKNLFTNSSGEFLSIKAMGPEVNQ